MNSIQETDTGKTDITDIYTKKVYSGIKKAADRLADTIFPPNIYCIACGRPIRPEDVYSLCPECRQNINWANGKLCRVCGKLLEDWYPRDICGECANRSRSFDSGVTCMQYRQLERRIIKDFKYKGKSYLARKLSEIIFDKITAMGCKFDIIVPVPMYPAKEKKRGYNQAALLGKYLGERTKTPFRSDCLLRVRQTAPMNQLGARERKKNLDKAFQVKDTAKSCLFGKRVLLIDDIYTTGTTAEHCSEVLKACGASEVIIVTIAAGVNQRELPDVRIE